MKDNKILNHSEEQKDHPESSAPSMKQTTKGNVKMDQHIPGFSDPDTTVKPDHSCMAGEGVKQPVPQNGKESPEVDAAGEAPKKIDFTGICDDFYYGGSRYCMRDGEQFIPVGEGQVKKHLGKRGLPGELIDDAMCFIRVANYVEWQGAIAGYQIGIHEDSDSGRKFLVTRAPSIIEAVEGSWELIGRVMDGLFEDEDYPEQCASVMAWVQQARENVKKGVRRPLPALAMIGPINAGKTLALEVIRLVLGGRSAAAYRSLTNDNGFNSDIIGAELLTVDDQMASRDPRARVRFGQAIKSQLFAASMRVEGKHRNAFSARPVHALAIALNDEPQHVHVLPEMDASLTDKISLIKTGRAGFLPGETDDRDKLMNRIRQELPAFIHFLESYEIPEHLRNSRTGASAWQHPAILAMLEEISPEGRLFELVQQCNLGEKNQQDGGSWRGTSAQIQHALMDDPATKQAARRLISWNGAVGTYMRRLIDKGQPGVSDGGQRQGIQTWVITRIDA